MDLLDSDVYQWSFEMEYLVSYEYALHFHKTCAMKQDKTFCRLYLHLHIFVGVLTSSVYLLWVCSLAQEARYILRQRTYFFLQHFK